MNSDKIGGAPHEFYLEFAPEDPENPGNDPGLSEYNRATEYRREIEAWNRENFTFGESVRFFGEPGEAARNRIEKFVRLAWGSQDVSVADLSQVVTFASEGKFQVPDRARIFLAALRNAGVRIASREEVFDASYRTYANTITDPAERKAAEAGVLENYKKFGIAVVSLSSVEEVLAKGPNLQDKTELRKVLSAIGVTRIVDSSEPTFFAQDGWIASARQYLLEPMYEIQRMINFERAAEKADTLEKRAFFEEAAGNARWAAGWSALDKVLWATMVYGGLRVPKSSSPEIFATESALSKGNPGKILVVEAGAAVPAAEAEFLAGRWKLGNFSQGRLPGTNLRYFGGGSAGGTGGAAAEGGGLSRVASTSPKPVVYTAAPEGAAAKTAQPARQRVVSPLEEKVPFKAPGREAPHQIEPKPSDNARISNPSVSPFGVPIVDQKGSHPPISNPDPKAGETMLALDPWMLDTLQPGQMILVKGGERPFREIRDGRVYFEESSGIGSVPVAEFRTENFGELPIADIRPTENGLSAVRLKSAERFLDEAIRVFRHVGPDGKTTYYALDGHHRLALAWQKGRPTVRVRFVDHTLEDVRYRMEKNADPSFPVPSTVGGLRVNPGRIDDFQGKAVASNLISNRKAQVWLDARIVEVLGDLTLPASSVDAVRAKLLIELGELTDVWGKKRLEDLDDVARETAAGEFIRRVEETLDGILEGGS